MIDKQIDPIGWRDAKIAELEEAIREFACTGTDEPCGCYRLLSQEKTEIARLRAELLNASFKLGALRSAAYDVKQIELAELCEEFRRETEASLNVEQTFDGEK